MDTEKLIGTPLANHFKLTIKQCPCTEEKKQKMDKVPYALAVGSLMYATVHMRLDIACAVSVVSIFLFNPGKEHCAPMKWIFRYLKGTSRHVFALGMINLFW